MNVHLTDKELIRIANSDNVFEIMQKILLRENMVDREKEHFWVLGLNTANKILFIELVSMGSAKQNTVEPMNVYRVAVMKGAVNIIMVHNHPSGNPDPSKADLDITDRLIQVGKILNIYVLDHLIITEKTYLSFADTDRMEKLEASEKWIPNFTLIEQIKKEEAQIRKEAVKEAREKGEKAGHKRGQKEKAIEMAKKSLKEGLSIDLISKLTGLTEAEISEL